jgi:hypothetical protein
MGRNLQLFKKARERIEAELTRKGVAPDAERGAYRVFRVTAPRGVSFLEEASLNSLENKLSNDINDVHFPTNAAHEPSPQKTESTGRPNAENAINAKSHFSQHFSTLAFGPPKGVLNQQWACAVADAEGFLAAWGDQAEALGWRADELFGLDPVAPFARYDTMGLIWFLQGCPVVALTHTSATIRMPTGNHLRFFRRAARGVPK